MGLYLICLVLVGATVYALVDCWGTPASDVRGLPRALWTLVVLVPLAGPLAYLLFGRPSGIGVPGRPRVAAPDDDPDFLRQLDQQRRRAAAEERRRQQQTDKRERKERERKEREHRKDRSADSGTPNSSGTPGEPAGDDPAS